MRRYNHGWRGESERHSLSARKIKTGTKLPNPLFPKYSLLAKGRKFKDKAEAYNIITQFLSDSDDMMQSLADNPEEAKKEVEEAQAAVNYLYDRSK